MCYIYRLISTLVLILESHAFHSCGVLKQIDEMKHLLVILMFDVLLLAKYHISLLTQTDNIALLYHVL